MLKKRLFAGLLVLLLAACTVHTSPAPTLTPSQSPSPTLPPGVTPSATLTPTLTPLPTPIPEVRIQTGDLAFFDGDYINAQLDYQTAISTTTDPAMLAAALWGLGQVEYAAGNNGKALVDLTNLVNTYPSDTNAARAYFLMGEIYMALERYPEAAQVYTTYLKLRPGVIDSFVQERLGDAYISAGNFTQAISAYKAALEAPHTGDDTSLQLEVAGAYASSGDANSALTLYGSIAKVSDNDYVKAQIDLLSGRIYLSLGQSSQAYQFFLDSVNNYPLSADTYNALVALVNNNVPVDDLKRGLVDYFAGQDGYAVDAFQRYIAANPKNDGTALYYEALALYGMGQYQNAVLLWNEFIQNYPDNPHWAAAWNGDANLPGRAYTQWYWLNQYDLAAQTLLSFVKQAPTDPNAPSYLEEAGRIQERGGKLEEAAKTWESVADEYPGSNLVPEALFWAGIARYRNATFAQALVTFQRDLQFSTADDDQARAYFWIGKTQQKQGDSASAQTAWQQAASLDPTNYYSLRSQDMLLKQPAFTPPPAINYTVDLTAERAQAETWLRVTFNLSPDTDLSAPGDLLTDPRLVRGTELWELGLKDNARLEFEALRAAVKENPAESYRLANYMLNLGLYRPAINAMRQVLTLAGMTTQSQTLAAPAYFNHVIYGLYYQNIIVPAAQQAGFDPLFLFSVIWQESQFEGFVQSTAGARGLLQIIPSTGQDIANNLSWPANYTSDDLYRPIISVTLGASYLEQQRARFNGDLPTTLAAYNAGPEAAEIWSGLSGSDSDLFLEVIRLDETSNYVRSIYENYSMYRTLYGTVP
ncbi:MAG: tetratricopeptide repeat protein [Anaerolineales bacterium]